MALPPPRKSLPQPRSAPAAQPPSSPSSAPAAQFPPPAPRKPLPWKLIIGSVSAVIVVAALAVTALLLWPQSLPDNAAATRAVTARLPDFLEFTSLRSVQYDALNEPGKILGTVRFAATLKEPLYEFDVAAYQREVDAVAVLQGQNDGLFETERVKVSVTPPVMLVTRMKTGDVIECCAQLAVEKVDKEWRLVAEDGALPVRGLPLAELKPRFKDQPYVIVSDPATAETLAQWQRQVDALRDQLKEVRAGHDANVQMWRDELRERFAEGTVYEGTVGATNSQSSDPVRLTVEKFLDDGQIIVAKFENPRLPADWARIRITTAITQNGIGAKAESVDKAKRDHQNENTGINNWFWWMRGRELRLGWSKENTATLALEISAERFVLKKVSQSAEK